MTTYEYIQIFVAILVIVDPVGALPVFISLTSDQTKLERRHTARVAAISVASALLIACLAGEPILKLFGISISSFQIAGGILLLLMALAMLPAKPRLSKHSPEEAQEAESMESIAVVPLAIPLMTGPAAMSTVIIYMHQAQGWFNTSFVILSCLAIGFIVWLTLRLAIPIGDYLGKTGINIITRIMGLILAAIAVEFLTAGILQAAGRLG